MASRSVVSVRGCRVSRTGGNALFVSHAARDVALEDNEVGPGIGDSAVAVVGSLVRSSGLGGRNFPLRVSIARNHIHDIGVYGKQVSGVYISVAGFVNVSDNTIHGAPSSGIKTDDTFVGGHRLEYNHIYDTTREVTDMGPINIHNRDRFYVAGDMPVFQKQNATQSKTHWDEFPAPFPRGPISVDAMHPTIVRGNVLRSQRRSGAVGVPGEWWGVQNTLTCVDLDDGGTRYEIYENVCIANGTQGYKLGHGIDDINYHNNILVTLSQGAPMTRGATQTNTIGVSGSGMNVKNNTCRFVGNVIAKLDAANDTKPYLVNNYDAKNTARRVPYSVVDNNVYFAAGSTVATLHSRADWLAAGLDAHSLWDVDPLLLNADAATNPNFPFGIKLGAGSPAFALGFHNFAYGPRQSS